MKKIAWASNLLLGVYEIIKRKYPKKSFSKEETETNLYEFPSLFSYFQGNTYYTYIIPHHTRGWHIWKSRGFSLFTQKCWSHQGKKKGKWTARQIFTRRLGHQKRVEVSVYIFDNEGFWIQYKLGHLGRYMGWYVMYVVSWVKSVWKYFYVYLCLFFRMEFFFVELSILNGN